MVDTNTNKYSGWGYAADSLAAASRLTGSIMQGRALREQGRYEAAMHRINRDNALDQAKDAKHRGEMSRAQLLQQAKGLIGNQRAKLAAQGIDVNSGSALDLQGDTAALAAADALQIKNNSMREAWGFQSQASTFNRQARMAQSTGNYMARQSIITGTGQFGSDISRASMRYYDATR